MASITVTATGAAPVATVRAELHLLLTATAPLPGEALSRLAVDIERLRGVLAERGVHDDDVTTEQLEVQPAWNERGGAEQAAGATSVRVLLGSLEAAASLADAVLAAIPGASVAQVAQRAVPTADEEADARRAAVTAAQARAQQLAAAMGGAIGGVLSLLEPGAKDGGWAAFAPNTAAAYRPTPHLWSAEREVTVTVTGVWELVASEVQTAPE